MYREIECFSSPACESAICASPRVVLPSPPHFCTVDVHTCTMRLIRPCKQEVSTPVCAELSLRSDQVQPRALLPQAHTCICKDTHGRRASPGLSAHDLIQVAWHQTYPLAGLYNVQLLMHIYLAPARRILAASPAYFRFFSLRCFSRPHIPSLGPLSSSLSHFFISSPLHFTFPSIPLPAKCPPHLSPPAQSLLHRARSFPPLLILQPPPLCCT